jgi:microcystin degradation protein MlrC
MRIAVGGFHIESSNYNPTLTRAEDFRIVRGDELLAAPAFQFLSDFDAEFLPTFYARAVPGAPIERATYDAFKAEFLDRLSAFVPVDGLYLALHGAAFVEGMEDAEADFIGAARALVGADCPISVSYDLHGNLSQRIIDEIDLYSAYRTAPHIDAEETMRRSVALLLRRLETGSRPAVCWAPIPVALPGERTTTTNEPGRSLYARLADIERNAGIWDAALMVGYVWVDEARVTAAAVMTGTDRAAMEQAAVDLAEAYWNARDAFDFGTRTGSVDECIGWAMASATGPVVLAESGDNPTAGGSGDRAEMLAALLDADADGVVFAGIADRPAVEAAIAAGLGASITISIGATIDKVGSKPIDVTARVAFLDVTGAPLERQAVLEIAGISLVVSARRRPYHLIEDFTCLGLDPRAARIVVVKSGYLSPEMEALANPSIMALSPGIVDQFVERLPRTRTPRPTFPFDTDFQFTPKVYWSARSVE